MSSRPGWVRSRKAVQALALVAFVGLFVLTQRDGVPGDLANVPMRLDPLLMLGASLAGRAVVVGAVLALATLALTLLFGRAWCGWLCPLGTVLDLVPGKPGRRPHLAVPESWRRVKYVLFLLILFAALLGNQTLLFLDPLAIFFRTLAAAVWPALDRIATSVEDVLVQIPGLDGPVSSVDAVVRPVLLPANPVSYQDAFLVASFFVGLLALNAFASRFWCRYLCPLGGFLGLISRVALFRRAATASCSGCGLCEEDCPTGTIDPARDYASDPAECTVCMKCTESCPLGAVKFKPALAWPKAGRTTRTRRELLLALGAAAAGIALFRSNLFAKRESPFLLRPPGSRESNADVVALTSCTRCSECVRVCPTGAIQPAFLQAGLEGMGTPVLVPRLGTATTPATPAARFARLRPSRCSAWRTSSGRSSARPSSTRTAAWPGPTTSPASSARRCARCPTRPSSSRSRISGGRTEPRSGCSCRTSSGTSASAAGSASTGVPSAATPPSASISRRWRLRSRPGARAAGRGPAIDSFLISHQTDTRQLPPWRAAPRANAMTGSPRFHAQIGLARGRVGVRGPSAAARGPSTPAGCRRHVNPESLGHAAARWRPRCRAAPRRAGPRRRPAAAPAAPRVAPPAISGQTEGADTRFGGLAPLM